jgi:hypothetical protein
MKTIKIELIVFSAISVLLLMTSVLMYMGFVSLY